VRVVVDPFDRTVETFEDNNEATANIIILTRPDLLIPTISLDEAEPVVGQDVQVEMPLQNDGQTAASASTLALTVEDPDNEVSVICEPTPAVPGEDTFTELCVWSPSAPGLHRLFAVGDNGGVIFESGEGNNHQWRDLYVGFAGPLLLDSGADDATDPPYDPASGYGYIADNTFASDFCGSTTEETQLVAGDGLVEYQFDHLLPGHFYHLDLTLYECDSIGRQQQILVNNQIVGDPIDLSSGEIHEVSILLDPAFYKEHAVTIGIEELLGNDAVVSAIALHDIDYRYADAGGANDPEYDVDADYGFVDGVEQDSWGTLPYQSRRTDLGDGDPTDDPDDELVYQFDNLDPTLRYFLRFVFYQNSVGLSEQTIWVDDISTGEMATLVDEEREDITVNVPLNAYFNDGSIEVQIRREDSTTGAFVNEISLEQKTLLDLPQIRDISIVNVNDIQATITWQTDRPTNGEVHYGPTRALGSVAYDDRGVQTTATTHFVSLLGLSPETDYFFYVVSADAVDDNEGALYQFRTGPTLGIGQNDTVYGQVFGPDGVTPAEGALVRILLLDEDGQPSLGQASPLEAIVQSSGYWSVNLGSARTDDLQAYFAYSPSGDQLQLNIDSGTGCAALQTIDTSDDTPAPSMSLVCPTQTVHNLDASWNLIALNLDSDPHPLAQEVLDEINAQGGDAEEINRRLNGRWDAHIDGLPFNNFQTIFTEAYFIRTNVSSVWVREGRPPLDVLPVDLYSGWNLVGFPKLAQPMDAEALLLDIQAQGGACDEIDKWSSGNWLGHPLGIPINLFDIRTDAGYFIRCSNAVTYIMSDAVYQTIFPAIEPVERSPEPEASQSLPLVEDITISNLRDVAFTLSWRTNTYSRGWVEFGTDPENLDQIAYDDRGEEIVSRLFHASLGGLAPETTYYVRIHAGESMIDQSGEPLPVTTGAIQSPSIPFTAYGQVVKANGTPAGGAIMQVRVHGDLVDGINLLTSLVDEYGYWSLSLPVEDCTTASLSLTVVEAEGSITERDISACNASPAPAMVTIPDYQPRIYTPLIQQ
ncbi:MAG: hypothetical protein GY759_19915, partial [Chloroflexi bacterium]|nr:hypothetical protein [Chloroflexota bacterium]